MAKARSAAGSQISRKSRSPYGDKHSPAAASPVRLTRRAGPLATLVAPDSGGVNGHRPTGTVATRCVRDGAARSAGHDSRRHIHSHQTGRDISPCPHPQ